MREAFRPQHPSKECERAIFRTSTTRRRRRDTPHLVHIHLPRASVRVHVYPRAERNQRDEPGGLADGGGRRGSCPPPRSAGVIASAQIEYISYVFITIPRARALLRRPAICRPPPVSRLPLSLTLPESLPVEGGGRGREKGRKVGRRKVENAHGASLPRRSERARERDRDCRRGCCRRRRVEREGEAEGRGRASEKGVATGNQA